MPVRKLKMLVLAFGAAWFFSSGVYADNVRVKSKLLEYIDSTKEKSQHRVVRRILVNSIGGLRAGLKKSSPGLEYLAKLGVSKISGTPLYDLEDLEKLWTDSSEPPIQILHGDIQPDTDNEGSQIIQSTVYIGNLPVTAGIEFTQNTFLIKTTTSLIDFGTIPNRHSYILTYALILDALGNKKPRHEILGLVGVASTIYSRLEKRALISKEITLIRDSIAKIASNAERDQ